MKRLMLLLAFLLQLSGLQAQTDLMKIFEEGLGKALHNGSVSSEEQHAVLKVLTVELKKHVTYSRGGGAKATLKLGGRNYYEWQELKPKRITSVKLSEADSLNGIEASYIVSMSAKAHRFFNSSTRKWSPWRQGGSAFFPSNLRVIKQNGKLKVSDNHQLNAHVPMH